MEREEAIRRLQQIVGEDLRQLADQSGITVFKEGKKNKGWVGHTLERYLGLPLNSAQSPNFGSWELKTVALKYNSKGRLAIKETMALTMIDAVNVANTPFAQSHLLAKLKKAIIVGRIWVSKDEPSSIIRCVKTFDLTNLELYRVIENDYNMIRENICEKNISLQGLSGRMGVLIQPRTKGPGHGSTSRAFYARKEFLKRYVFQELFTNTGKI